jgi:uncharacterized oxidoreductase
MDLTDAIVLVTGGGSGIGLELSRQLTARGNTVVVCGRNAEKLKSVADIHGFHAISGDVTVAADQERILGAIEASHGRLDLLINNAGVFGVYDFATDPDTLTRIETEIAINATAPLTLTSRALPLLKKSRQPAVLFIGSGIAFVPFPSTPVYSGTKALIHHVSQTLREQFRPYGIAVFEAMPPVVDTDMAKVMTSNAFRKMKPEDLVHAILDGLDKDRLEIVIGQSKQIKLMSRLAPRFIFRQFAKTRLN